MTTGANIESSGEVSRFEPGDVVRVREEELLSVVVLPTHRPCEVPDDAPDLGGLCCVPIALVRTPVNDEHGVKRWVEISDLTRVEPETEDSMSLPGDVPPGSFIFHAAAGVWVEVTGEPLTDGDVTTIPVIDGFNVPMRFDAHAQITVCHGLIG